MKETPNLSYLEKISKGNRLFVKALIDIIKRELPNEITSYHLHLSNGDLIQTAGDVHKINHKIKILGLENSFNIAEQYRLNLLQNRQVLKIDFEHILKVLSLYIKKE